MFFDVLVKKSCFFANAWGARRVVATPQKSIHFEFFFITIYKWAIWYLDMDNHGNGITVFFDVFFEKKTFFENAWGPSSADMGWY